MKVGNGTNRFAYNAQAVVDAKEGVIVACEVTRGETDTGQLVPMIEQARENLAEAAPDTMTLADNGYGGGRGFGAAAAGKATAGAGAARRGQTVRPVTSPTPAEHFYYDPQARRVHLPQGQRLDWEGRSTEKARPTGAALPLPLSRLPGARAMHPRSQDRQMDIWPPSP